MIRVGSLLQINIVFWYIILFISELWMLLVLNTRLLLKCVFMLQIVQTQFGLGVLFKMSWNRSLNCTDLNSALKAVLLNGMPASVLPMSIS